MGTTRAIDAEFSELLATGIENAEVREAVRQLAEEQAALRRVATLVAESPESEGLFSAVAREVANLLDVRGVIVDRFETDGSQVTLGSAYDLELASAEAFLGVGARWPLQPGKLAAAVQETRRAARVEDYTKLDVNTGAAARAAGIGSGCAAPIFVDGELWGQMCVFSASGTVLPPDTESRLDDFVKLVATAISNHEARVSLRVLADEQAALRRVATLVAQDAPPDKVFEAVAAEVGELLDSNLTVVTRYDGDGAATAIGSWSSSPGAIPVGTRSSIGGHNVLSIVADTGKPARLDAYEEATGESAEIARRYGWRSSIAAPITVEGRVWGVMLVATQRDEPFPAGDELRLAQFTDLVATAVANAEAHVAVQAAADEQGALRRVATLVAASAAPPDVFAAVAKEIGLVLGAHSTLLCRADRDGAAVIVGTWGDSTPALGTRLPRGGTNLTTIVLETGHSARIESYDDATGAASEIARSQGLRSAVGAPIVVEGRLWGLVIAGTRGDEPLPPSAEQRLGEFTELVATAISNATARSELVASRARIVAASDETRRRIERDLHDGTQQRLVSLGMAVRAAEANLPPERDDLRAQLSRVATGLLAAVEDLQEISRGIHPAILAKGGLGPALRTLAHRSTIPVDLDIEMDERLAEPIEAAAYFVASEALANAAKHSQASRIDVSLEQRDGSLVLSVGDDGIGGADPSRGSGLIGLADRVEALGGSISVHSRDGNGTQITAELPLELDVPQLVG